MPRSVVAGAGGEDLESAIDMLDRALADHSLWIANWFRSMICRLPHEESQVAVQGHRLCELGRWYYGESSKVLTDHEDFTCIHGLHAAMHEAARELALRWKDGGTIPVELYDDFAHKEQALSLALLRLRDDMKEILSARDALTGIMNREAFLLIAAQERARAARRGEPCCISILDIDHFKKINDRYGHAGGDKVIRAVAAHLSHNLRPYDSLCRWGGDEFTICLPDTASDVALEVLDRLRSRLAATPIVIERGARVRVTASFGLSSVRPDRTLEEVITDADRALYEAKHAGRNRVQIYPRPRRRPQPARARARTV